MLYSMLLPINCQETGLKTFLYLAFFEYYHVTSWNTLLKMTLGRWKLSEVHRLDTFCCFLLDTSCATLKANIKKKKKKLFIYCQRHWAEFQFVTSKSKLWWHIVQNICFANIFLSFFMSCRRPGISTDTWWPVPPSPVGVFLVCTRLLASTSGYVLGHHWCYEQIHLSLFLSCCCNIWKTSFVWRHLITRKDSQWKPSSWTRLLPANWLTLVADLQVVACFHLCESETGRKGSSSHALSSVSPANNHVVFLPGGVFIQLLCLPLLSFSSLLSSAGSMELIPSRLSAAFVSNTQAGKKEEEEDGKALLSFKEVCTLLPRRRLSALQPFEFLDQNKENMWAQMHRAPVWLVGLEDAEETGSLQPTESICER